MTESRHSARCVPSLNQNLRHGGHLGLAALHRHFAAFLLYGWTYKSFPRLAGWLAGYREPFSWSLPSPDFSAGTPTDSTRVPKPKLHFAEATYTLMVAIRFHVCGT